MATVWIIVASLFAGVRAMQHHCHVCLSETSSDVEIERVFPGAKLESCHLSSTIMVCPDTYKGCLTQSKGDQVMRTCAQLAVDACRWANGVEYCYCMGNLCNTPPPRPPTSDDEDLEENTEGSGAHSDTPDMIESSTSTTTDKIPTISSRAVVTESSVVYLTISLIVSVWR
ncbi:uncharacterized protein LOC128992382 [Macrosteles quadrilineatus]|uniref:uncharacterized protein LOC128992382 n=1 Tax=Macrosteles quadrilineatus TaxID=74068 RepID=UPI0023E180D3|nr:uncharacterized protein LOC128992382 [Macrosteles quadrilineatus]